MADKKSFYLLNALHYVPVTDAKVWLGRIVNDFRNPRAGYTPSRTPSPYIDADEDPNFSNLSLTLDSIRSNSVKLDVMGMAGVSADQANSRKHFFQTQKVARWRIHNDDMVLQTMLGQPEVRSDLERWDFGLFTPLYLIVGFLVTDHISSGSQVSNSHAYGGNVDPAQIAALSAGVVVPVQGEIGVKHSTSRSSDIKVQVDGKRIIAIEYRSFRKRIFQNASRQPALARHGPQGDRVFSDYSEANLTFADSNLEARQEVQTMLDPEDFEEVIESEVGENELERCFMMDSHS